MAETDSKTWKLKMKHSPMVLMNRVDYETAANAYLYSLGVKMADEDVSFLLGKPDNYFFDTLDPTEKTKFKFEQVPLFVPILSAKLKDILPDKDINPDDDVTVSATTKYNKKSIIYRHTVTYADGSTSDEIVWVKKVVKGVRKLENPAVTAYIRKLIRDGYFLTPRTALHLYILLGEKLGNAFTVADLRVSLKKLTRKEGARPLLQRNNDDGRYTYSEHYHIEPAEDVEALGELFNVKVGDISSLTLYTIADLDKNTLGFMGLDGRKLVAIHVLPKHYRIRLGTRLVDFAVALDKVSPLVVELPVDSPILLFLEVCGFKESEADKKHREENKIGTMKLSRKK